MARVCRKYDEVTNGVDVTTYDNRTAGTSEHYPLLSFRCYIRVARGNPHRFVTTNNYQEVNIFAPSSYNTRLTSSVEEETILNDTPPPPADYFVYGLRDRHAGESDGAIHHDQFDNQARATRQARRVALDTNYSPVSNTGLWLMNMVQNKTVTSTNSIGETLTRTNAYTYESTRCSSIPRRFRRSQRPVDHDLHPRRRARSGHAEDDRCHDDGRRHQLPTGTTITDGSTTYDAVDGVTVASVTRSASSNGARPTTRRAKRRVAYTMASACSRRPKTPTT